VASKLYHSLKTAVIIPAYNEERLIGLTLENVPSCVDAIYVTDDGSHDKTSEAVLKLAVTDTRIQLLQHLNNKGVGGAIITGYKQAFKDGHDVFVVVGGDAQMDWNDLDNMIDPIRQGEADYTKGNRFMYGTSKDCSGNAWREMPALRILGNVTLSVLTKIASGYYHLYDSQMGYTAMHRRVFSVVDWNKVRQGYGYPAEWLMRFHTHGVRVVDVPVRAIYMDNERQTQIKVRKFLFYMLGVLVRGWISRLRREYFTRGNGKSKKVRLREKSGIERHA
jgi:glycosyltransferase involved in cell wall biosynthesis